jgi:hypothetical protein
MSLVSSNLRARAREEIRVLAIDARRLAVADPWNNDDIVTAIERLAAAVTALANMLEELEP